MASGRGQLTPEQNGIFHENYEYMWNKLSVTYYQVSQTPEKCRRIRGREQLPSYAYLCRCMKADYVPTLGTVNKIVDFYNANITPKVSSYQFISELLSRQDAMRRCADDCCHIDKLLGVYYGYSRLAQGGGKISGSIMNIYALPEGEGGERNCRVILLDGICEPELMYSERLLDLLKIRVPNETSLKNENDAADKQALRLYTGDVQIQDRTVLMNMNSVSNAADRVSIAMDIDMLASVVEEATVSEHPAGEKYDGGMAVVMKAGGREGIQVFLRGIVRVDAQVIPHITVHAKGLARLLRISSENSRAGCLSVGFDENQKWRSYLRRLKRESDKTVQTQKHNAE